MVYYSTGNPGLWSPAYRCPDKTHEECNAGGFDNKWSMTIFGRKVEDGCCGLRLPDDALRPVGL